MAIILGAARGPALLDSLIGLVTCFATHDGIPAVARAAWFPVDPVANAAQPREVAQVLRRGGSAGHLRDRATSRRVA
jgi:hypothetical protein